MRVVERFSRPLLAAFLAAPLTAVGQEYKVGTVYRVGYITGATPLSELTGSELVHLPTRAFLHGLRDLGYVKGQNLVPERRSAEGRFERFGDIVAELVRLEAGVIVTAEFGGSAGS